MSTPLNGRTVCRGLVLSIGSLGIVGIVSSVGFGDDPKPTVAKPAAPTSAEPAKPTPKSVSALGEDEARERIERLLVQETTNLDFEETPLKEAMQFIGSFHNVNVVMDAKSLEEATIAIDQPLTMHLSGITLASGLKLMLEPLQLTYVVENEVLKITTLEVANHRYETRVYDVRKLMEAGYDPELLTKIISPVLRVQDGNCTSTSDGKTVKGEQGKLGEAVIAIPEGLVIYQTQPAHREIAKLLRQLERHAAGKRASNPTGKGQASVPSEMR